MIKVKVFSPTGFIEEIIYLPFCESFFNSSVRFLERYYKLNYGEGMGYRVVYDKNSHPMLVGGASLEDPPRPIEITPIKVPPGKINKLIKLTYGWSKEEIWVSSDILDLLETLQKTFPDRQIGCSKTKNKIYFYDNDRYLMFGASWEYLGESSMEFDHNVKLDE